MELAPVELRTEAAARAMALACGALSLEQVTEWADAEIAGREDFDAGLIDVSLAKTAAEALSALNGFEPATDKPSVAARVFQFFHQSLVSGGGLHQDIARALFDMAMNGYIPAPEFEGPMSAYWDDLDLAVDGIHGDPEAIKQDLLTFLAGAES